MDPSRVLTMVLAGGAGVRLLPLTRERCKPAVPFAGSLRVIDFTLMNCAASGLRAVYVLTQYQAQSLHEHLQHRWGTWPGTGAGFVRARPARSSELSPSREYRGTADAVLKNLDLLGRHRPQVVLILAGDHVYHAAYQSLIDAHLEQRADVTVLSGQVPAGVASAFGVLQLHSQRRVARFVEKPRDPRPYEVDGQCPINLGVYCFDPEFLARRLLADAADPSSCHDFGKDILPASVVLGRVLSFPLARVAPDSQPYWRDVGTIESYFEANMDLLRPEPPFSLADPRWPPDSPFHKWIGELRPAEGRAADRLAGGRNLIAGPADVAGARLTNCVISPRVRVAPGVELEECILFPGASVGEGARLRRAIVEEGMHVPAGACIGKWKDGAEAGEGIVVVQTEYPVERSTPGRPVPSPGSEICSFHATRPFSPTR